MPVLKNPEKAAELVALIYKLELELVQKKRLQDTAKLSLILLEAPPKIAAKVLLGEDLLEAELVALREAVAGKYFDGAGREATVVVPAAGGDKYELYPKDAYKAWLILKGVKKSNVKLERAWRAEREAQARDLAGEDFATLFDHLTSYLPAPGFVEFAPRLLTPAKSRDLLQLCEQKGKPAAPHVKIAKPEEEEE